MEQFHHSDPSTRSPFFPAPIRTVAAESSPNACLTWFFPTLGGQSAMGSFYA
jgi:hypothetical protein